MIYAGGIWTITIVSALACGYAWVFGARRVVYLAIMAVAAGSILASQVFLTASHPFHTSVYGDLVFLFWASVIAVPVGFYIMFLRWARHKAEERHDA